MSLRPTAAEVVASLERESLPPLDSTIVDDLSVDKGGQPLGQILDSAKNPYNVLHCGPNERMYPQIASRLRHMAFQDPMGVNDKGLKRDLEDPEEAAETFLFGHGGRSLYMAERDGQIFAFDWFRSLQEAENDLMLAKLYLEALGMKDTERLNPNADKEQAVYFDELATVATYYQYSEEGVQLVTPLTHVATDHFLDSHPEARVVIGSFTGGNPMVLEIIGGSDRSGGGKYLYHNFYGGAGYQLLAAIQDEQPKESSQEETGQTEESLV